jgi:hypothetical protein
MTELIDAIADALRVADNSGNALVAAVLAHALDIARSMASDSFTPLTRV